MLRVIVPYDLPGTLAVARVVGDPAAFDRGLAEGQGWTTDRAAAVGLAGAAELDTGPGQLPVCAPHRHDLEQTGLLEGAPDGLGRRVGLRAWPMLRPTETEPMTKLRRALGADRLDQVFSAGSRLNQQQAVAAIRGRRGAHGQTS